MTVVKEQLEYGVTIDSASSRDLDDAFNCHFDLEGNLIVNVFVTDITGLVSIGSPSDQEARKLGSSTYRSHFMVKPMLSEVITESGSLLPNQKRDAVAVELKFDQATFEHLSTVFRLVKFQSVSRFTYSQAAHFALENMDFPSISPESEFSFAQNIFPKLGQLALALFENRKKRGSLCMLIQSKGIEITEDLNIRQLTPENSNIGYLIIQELAILANGEISRFAQENQIPFLFRNHKMKFSTENDTEKLVLRHLIVEELMRYLQETTRPNSNFVGNIIKPLRSGMEIERAFYGSHNLGHFGLALPVYAHNTSPLRRYADLVNQRQLVGFLGPKSQFPYSMDEIEQIGKQLNEVLAEKVIAKDSSQRDERIANRIKIIKNLEKDSQQTKKEIVKVSDGEFYKTLETWLDQLNPDKDQSSEEKLLESIENRLAAQTLQPKLAAYVIAFRMTDQPKLINLSKVNGTGSEKLAQLTNKIFRWMAEDLSRAVQVWSVLPDAFPYSKWKMPELEFSANGQKLFVCQAVLGIDGFTILKAKRMAVQKQRTKELALFDLFCQLKGLKFSDFEQFFITPVSGTCPVSIMEQKAVFNDIYLHCSQGNFKAALNEFIERTNLTQEFSDYQSTEIRNGKELRFHTKVFLQVSGKTLQTETSNLSKKKSESEVAHLLLNLLALEYEMSDFKQKFPTPTKETKQNPELSAGLNQSSKIIPEVNGTNFIGAIETYFRRIKQSLPVYQVIPNDSADNAKIWEVEIKSFHFDQEYTFRASGVSLSEARQKAAQQLFGELVNELKNKN